MRFVITFREVIEIMGIDVVIGAGNYAAFGAKIALKDADVLLQSSKFYKRTKVNIGK